MEKKLEVRKHKSKYEVSITLGRRNKTTYHIILDNDPAKIAQMMMDLEFIGGYKIPEAINIYLDRMQRKDWLGL